MLKIFAVPVLALSFLLGGCATLTKEQTVAFIDAVQQNVIALCGIVPVAADIVGVWFPGDATATVSTISHAICDAFTKTVQTHNYTYLGKQRYGGTLRDVISVDVNGKPVRVIVLRRGVVGRGQ